MSLQFASMQGLPVERPPGYFDPSITAWQKVADIWDSPEQSKALAAIAAVGAFFVLALNIASGSFKLVGVSRLNNALYEEVRSLIDGVDALKYKEKRLKYDALKSLANTERRKIVDMIFQPNNAIGSSTPFQLAASKLIIFSEISELIELPEAFWTDFLQDIFGTHGALIQTGLDEIDQILNDSTKIQEQVDLYLASFQERITKCQALESQKSQREQQLTDLKQQLDNVADADKDHVKKQIERMESKISDLSKQMDQLISKKDFEALNSSWFRNSHFTKIVKQKLMQRKAFLESIKLQKNQYVGYADKPTSWTKTALIGLSIIGAAAGGWYVYNNGVPSLSELSSLASGAYSKASVGAAYVWGNTPSFQDVKTKTGNLWESATWDNISGTSSEYASYASEKAKMAWNGMTMDNLKSTASSAKESALNGFAAAQTRFQNHGYDFGFNSNQDQPQDFSSARSSQHESKTTQQDL